jgi:hypothetical protein
MALPALKSGNAGSAILQTTARYVELNLVKGLCDTICFFVFQPRNPSKN